MNYASRAPPPQGPPPTYAFVSRVYQKSLRPIVLTTAFLGGIWALFSGIGWFRNFGIDRTQQVPEIASLSLALGAMYLAVAFVGAFGIFSAATQRARLVKIYAILSAFATLIVIGAGLTRVVTHFLWKNDLIKECTTLTTNKQIVYYGFWGPITHQIISPDEANSWCTHSWDHDSWAEIIALLVISVIGVLFTAAAFSYHRQLLDPTSPVNASRISAFSRQGAFPTHYNPPYNASVPNLPYAYTANSPYGVHGETERDDPFAPPYDGKPPSYVGDGKVYGDRSKGEANDPFMDVESRNTQSERDVTNRPGPGGDEAFRRT